LLFLSSGSEVYLTNGTSAAISGFYSIKTFSEPISIYVNIETLGSAIFGSETRFSLDSLLINPLFLGLSFLYPFKLSVLLSKKVEFVVFNAFSLVAGSSLLL